MFEPSLFTEALAAAPAASPPQVDQSTLMYIIGGVVMGIVGGIGGLLYRKAPNSEKAKIGEQEIEDAKVFFQGPFQQIIDRLNTLLLTLERLVGQSTDLKEAFADTLRQTRHDLKNTLQVMSQENEHDVEEIKRLLHDAATVLGRLDEFLRARMK